LTRRANLCKATSVGSSTTRGPCDSTWAPKSVDVFESVDGIHFKGPGARLSGGIFTTIFLDAHDPDPARRYKLFYLEFAPPFDPAKHGVYASYSADGVHFTKIGRVLPFLPITRLLFSGTIASASTSSTRAPSDYHSENQRRIGRIVTDDPLKPWPFHKTANDRMFLAVENVEVVLSADRADDPHSDIYLQCRHDLPVGGRRPPDVHVAVFDTFRRSETHSSNQTSPVNGRTLACLRCSWP